MATVVKPRVKLLGADGNVYNVIGLCKRAALNAGWSKEETSRLIDRMFNCHSYNEVMAIVMETFDVR